MNSAKKLQGRIDCPLNEKGMLEALAARAGFDELGVRFDKVFSSPLSRAVKTAAVVSGRDDITRCPEITEMDFGKFEGMSYSDIGKEMHDFLNDPVGSSAPDGVETLDSLIKRTESFCEMLRKCKYECVLAVTHGIALRSIIYNMIQDQSAWSSHIGNCVIYKTELRFAKFSAPERLILTDYFGEDVKL